MKKLIVTCCSAGIFLAACNNGASDSKPKADSAKYENGGKKDASPVIVPDSATVAKNWQMYMTPGDMQKMIASWDGDWNTEMTMWDKPGAPPSKTAGTTQNKMIMGGRYQVSHHTAVMMGLPFEGQGTLGYDNARKMLVSSWIDNFGTGILNISGPWDAATKSATLTGKEMDPSTLMEKDFKEIFKVIDDNTQSLEMFGPGNDGKEIKMMEIRYTRKK